MSDAMTNREIEDVLTSIRRLVAQEGHRPAASERLILTEAQRIAPTPPAEANVQAAPVADPSQDEGATVPEAEVGDARSDTPQAEDGHDDELPAPVQGAVLPAPDFGKLEATIAELEAAVSASGEGWEAEEPTAEAPRASNVTDLYGRLSFKHRASRDGAADTQAPAEAGEAEESPVVAEAEALVRATPAESPVAPPLEETLEDALTERASAVAADAVIEEIAGAVEDPAVTGDFAMDDFAGDDAAQDEMRLDEPEDMAEEAVIDEAMLRALVAQIVREELHGQLGERITQQVRKLVRAEIARALDDRTYL